MHACYNLACPVEKSNESLAEVTPYSMIMGSSGSATFPEVSVVLLLEPAPRPRAITLIVILLGLLLEVSPVAEELSAEKAPSANLLLRGLAILDDP